MDNKLTLRSLLQRVHNDERGAVTLETVLIIGAIALPILIFLLRFAWPRIEAFFESGLDAVEEESHNVGSGNLFDTPTEVADP